MSSPAFLSKILGSNLYLQYFPKNSYAILKTFLPKLSMEQQEFLDDHKEILEEEEAFGIDTCNYTFKLSLTWWPIIWRN